MCSKVLLNLRIKSTNPWLFPGLSPLLISWLKAPRVRAGESHCAIMFVTSEDRLGHGRQAKHQLSRATMEGHLSWPVFMPTDKFSLSVKSVQSVREGEINGTVE